MPLDEYPRLTPIKTQRSKAVLERELFEVADEFVEKAKDVEKSAVIMALSRMLNELLK